MGVRIDHRRLAVSGPTGMADAAGACKALPPSVISLNTFRRPLALTTSILPAAFCTAETRPSHSPRYSSLARPSNRIGAAWAAPVKPTIPHIRVAPPCLCSVRYRSCFLTIYAHKYILFYEKCLLFCKKRRAAVKGYGRRCAYSPLPSSYTIRLITSSCASISLPRLQNLGKYKS